MPLSVAGGDDGGDGDGRLVGRWQGLATKGWSLVVSVGNGGGELRHRQARQYTSMLER